VGGGPHLRYPPLLERRAGSVPTRKAVQPPIDLGRHWCIVTFIVPISPPRSPLIAFFSASIALFSKQTGERDPKRFPLSEADSRSAKKT
jgi:hypothetical protein